MKRGPNNYIPHRQEHLQNKYLRKYMYIQSNQKHLGNREIKIVNLKNCKHHIILMILSRSPSDLTGMIQHFQMMKEWKNLPHSVHHL